ncbi:MAG: methyltransferase [Acidobacteria bacterium]|nr:methyltransferase [Acidobacteriota bacterium]
MGTDDYRTRGQYQFGHTDLASRRLAVLARVFRSSTEAFLRDAPLDGARRALDLGCGPGHTTRLLAELLPRARVMGLDLSPDFLAESASAPGPDVEYARLDVAREELPAADLAFCRYLLSHLPEPAAALARWSSALSAGGLLLVEELEAIHPKQPAFAQYLALVEAMLADQGSTLFVGPALAALEDPPGLERVLDRAYSLPVPAHDAALMFKMNVPNWRDRPFIRARCSEDEIAALEAELDRLHQAAEGEPVLWELRQIAWRRSSR